MRRCQFPQRSNAGNAGVVGLGARPPNLELPAGYGPRGRTSAAAPRADAQTQPHGMVQLVYLPWARADPRHCRRAVAMPSSKSTELGASHHHRACADDAARLNTLHRAGFKMLSGLPSPQINTFMPERVFVLGGTGTIGRATVQALVRAGHKVVCLVRTKPDRAAQMSRTSADNLLAGAQLRQADVTDQLICH